MAKLTRADFDTLEKLIDKSNVKEVLLTITDVCYEKADFIEENWQDRATARYWQAAGHKIQTAAGRVDV